MIDLQRVFLNPFDDKEINVSQESSYGAAQLSLLVAGNDGGRFDVRIAATSAALGALEGGMTDEWTKLAMQKARTFAKKKFREGITAKMARIHAAVVAVFGEDAPDSVGCFPEGRRVFRVCREEELNNKLEQLIAALTARQAQIGSAAVTSATALLADWNALHSAHGTATAQAGASAAARRAARKALKLELFRNVLTLALLFPGEPAKCALYCPQHLLRRPQASGAPQPAGLKAGAWDAATKKVALKMHSPDAKHFDLRRRVAGAEEFLTVAENLAADTGGNATYEDTVAPGDYEYQAVPKRNGKAGAESEIVPVNAG